jgi:predicted nucleotidyltransferase
MQATQLKTILRDYFKTQPAICAAYLFGSQARGRPSPFSDVDVAVLLDQTVVPSRYFDEELRLGIELSKLLGHDDVDVVILNRAGPFLRFQVYRTGVPVCERDRILARRFIARSILEFFDFEPIKNRIERAWLKRLDHWTAHG